MTFRPAVVPLLLGFILAACSTSSTGSTEVERSVSTFTCCSALDVGKVYHPGQVLTIHWSRHSSYRLAPARPSRLTLSVALHGQFASVDRAKAASGFGSRLALAKPVQLSDEAVSAPVARMRIPANAKPGFYNLVAKIDFGGGSSETGASSIRIVER